MNTEKLARANRLQKDIDHYKWQLKYIDIMRKSDVKAIISTENGGCNAVDVPNETAKEIILSGICGVYRDLLEKAENEFASL